MRWFKWAALAALLFVGSQAGAQQTFSAYVNALPNATTPLAGTEQIFVIQSSNPKKTLASNLGVLVSLQPRQQRLITGAGSLPLVANDSILNINSSSPLTITLPAASGRNGLPLTFKDIAGKAGANNITFNTTGGDTIDGMASGVVKIVTNFQSFSFVPANDGTSTGYTIQ